MTSSKDGYRIGLEKGKLLMQDGRSGTVSNMAVFWQDSARALVAVVSIPAAELIDKVKAFHKERLQAAPSLTQYPELRDYQDYLLEVERGMRDGGADEATLALSLSLTFWRATRLLQETGRAYYAQAVPEKCRVLYLADSDRGALHFKNVDDPLTYWQPSPPTPQGSPWPFEHPLVFDGVGSGLHIDEIPPEIFPVDVRGLCKKHCTTVPEAEEFLTRYNYFWSSANVLVHDHKGNSVAFEKTACRVATRGPNAAGINFVNGMSAVDKGIFDFHRQQRQKYLDQIGADWDNSPDGCFFTVCEGKIKNMQSYVDELSLNPTWDNAKQLMEQRDPSGPMCLTGEKSHPDQQVAGCTLQMRAYEMDTRKQHLRQWRGDVPACLDTPEIVEYE